MHDIATGVYSDMTEHGWDAMTGRRFTDWSSQRTFSCCARLARSEASVCTRVIERLYSRMIC